MSESVQPGFLSCSDLDVVAIHAYGTGDYDTSSIETYVQQAQTAGKKLIMEEWGACYFDTDNNNCPSGDALPTDTRNANIQAWASQITAAGLPWLYWEVLPNADPHVRSSFNIAISANTVQQWGSDFEVGIGDPSWDTLQDAALAALSASAAFDFSEFLL